MRDRLHNRNMRRNTSPPPPQPAIESTTETASTNELNQIQSSGRYHHMQPSDYDLIANIDNYALNLALKESMKTYIEETQ